MPTAALPHARRTGGTSQPCAECTQSRSNRQQQKQLGPARAGLRCCPYSQTTGLCLYTPAPDRKERGRGEHEQLTCCVYLSHNSPFFSPSFAHVSAPSHLPASAFAHVHAHNNKCVGTLQLTHVRTACPTPHHSTAYPRFPPTRSTCSTPSPTAGLLMRNLL